MISASAQTINSQHSVVLQHAVLRVMLYYDLFSYPLTVDEIFFHCSEKNSSKAAVEHALSQLIADGIVFRHNEFYSVQNSKELFLRRQRGNKNAEGAMNKVHRRSKLISSFPFVRSVCISGSFSKNYFDETTDIDFFIITEPNRLWICRTLLIFFKKIFLLNSKKYFCVNYFIDSESLQIPDKNIFTATELVTLIPAYNYDLYQKFYEKNNWVKSFFPNSEPRMQNGTLRNTSPAVKQLMEKVLSGSFGEWLDKYFFRKTLSHWRKKFGGQPHHEFELNMRSRRSVSKHHPQGFQFQVLKQFEERLRQFEEQHQIQFTAHSELVN